MRKENMENKMDESISLTLKDRMFVELKKSKTAQFGLVIIVLFIFMAIFAPLISPYNPLDQDISQRLRPPSKTHLFGTDQLGRDVLSRVIYGSRISLIVGFSAVFISGIIGIALGMISGFYGGKIDTVIMRLVDIQLSLPFILLAIAIMAVLGPGLKNIILVLGITGWVIYARIVRGETLKTKNIDFVKAAVALGNSDIKILYTHVLPNVLASAIVVATLEMARMIIMEAALSFLGLGIQPPIPSWGSMVADGRDYITNAWWLITFPGLAIMITVLGINLFGDWLRDSLDPKLRL